jgi:cytochrome c
MFCGAWAGILLVPEDYPAEAAYKVPGIPDVPVDLAALQRGWPTRTAEPGERVRLIDYMAKVEKGAVTPPPITGEAGPTATAVTEPEIDLGTRLASANVEQGKGAARVCSTCHNMAQGGPNMVGPNLWGIVGRDIASHGGFTYSSAMTAQSGNWSYERLDQYLARPARAVPGNKMAFGGIRNGADRANLLAYLGSLNSTPAPFPAAKAPPPKGMKLSSR